MTVIDTPEGIEFTKLCSFRGRLRLELAGMTSRVPTLKAYNQWRGTEFSTKQAALADIEERIAHHKKQVIIVNEAKGWLIECFPGNREEIAAGTAANVEKWIDTHFEGGWHEFQAICEPLLEVG